MRVLDNLQPQKVFSFFEDICNIPHGSTNLDGISSYLEEFAKERELEYRRDEANNVIIIKEATKGYEDVEPIIIQGHMDMVAVKKADCDIDLQKDPLRLKIDGDYVYAEGTSLGGDDGIAVAYALAILDADDIAHPRIEAVITTDEEIGMEGATAIDLSMLKAKRMLNIDSEVEGVLLTSCAGGARVDCDIPVQRETTQGICYELKVNGLQGGHSGTEIDKERGNAIKILGRVLYELQKGTELQIVTMQGGEKDNVIPREASAQVIVNDEKEFQSVLEEIKLTLKNEYAVKEKGLSVQAAFQDKQTARVLTREATEKIAEFLMVLPNGVVAMSTYMKGLVETSLNVGIMNLSDDTFRSVSSVRSSIDTAKQNVVESLKILVKKFGGSSSVHGEYPGWQFNPDSELRVTMLTIYKEMFGVEAKVKAFHAGLECGIMIAKIPGLDCVSFGPNIYNIHTTEEKISISSTERMWNYILEILKAK